MRELVGHPFLWGLLFLIGAGVLCGLYAYGMVQRSRRIAAEGIKTLATIEKLEARRRSIYFRSGIWFRPLVHYASIVFHPEGREPRRAEVEVEPSFYETLSVGDEIPLRHLPKAPGAFEIEPGRHARDARMVWFLMAAFLGAAALALNKMLRGEG